MSKSRPLRSLLLVSFLTLSLALAAGPIARSAAADRPAAQTEQPFPVSALLPKAETGVDRFLAEHPKYDGRGVIVAIFDSGVDPGAPGLRVTTEGKPKILDVIDGAGAGDVVTSTIRSVEDGKIEGLSGRLLTPHKKWKNPSGEYHVGIKPAFEIFPRGLVRRLKEERRKDFDEQHRAAIATARRNLELWDEANPQPSQRELEQREDLAARLEQLEALAEEYEDAGPVYDCVVFNDGERWWAALDTDEDGDFNDETTLTNYRDERKYATFGDRDLLNYVLNIYDDGNLLSIVADAGAHGTHVAGIVAAHYPDKPEMDGIAPGAQLLVVKIGDTRLGSSSAGTGDVRGFVNVLQHGADLVNMSYGGPTPIPNQGRLEELRGQLVNDHGVIYVCSAGNSGPGLSTIGGPGGTTEATFGIGAVVSPEMMAAQYSLRETHPELYYTWSSRGPTTDGDLGVDFAAPGGAIAPVPNWLLQGNTLMNGTSMSSPSVCGGIALLLSGLKDKGIEYTPHSVRRALANTARWVPDQDPWAQGAGVVQIDKAFEHLVQHAARADKDVRYEITVAGRAGARGIYLREPFEIDRPFAANVTVDPEYPEEGDNRAKVDYEKRVNLVVTEPWVQAPESLLLMHGGRRFEVRVDPTGLPPGAHFAEVRGLDAAAPDLGPLFSVPVTVVRPLELGPQDEFTHKETLHFRSGQIERRFFAVPAGATWADFVIRRLDTDTSRLLVLQAVLLAEGEPYAANWIDEYLRFAESDVQVRSMPVVGGRTLEVDFAQYWSSLGESDFEVEVVFHGLVPSAERIAFQGDAAAVPLDVTAKLESESISPDGELDVLRRPLRPTETTIRALSPERDLLWDGRQVYELVATYEFEVPEDAEYKVRPVVSQLPYTEESYESHLWMILDENDRRLAVGVGTDRSGGADLEKGEYRLLLHLRHDDPKALERVENLPLYLDRELKKTISLKFYRSESAAVDGGGPFGSRRLLAGERARLYVQTPAADVLPEGADPGDLLLGTIHFGEKDADLLGPGQRPGGYPVVVTVPPEIPEKKEPKAKDEEPEDERGELEKLAEDVRDLKVERLEKLMGDEQTEEFEALAAEILSEWPGHLPVLVAQLKRVDQDKGKGDAQMIVAAAERVIAEIDTLELAAHFGVGVDEDDPAAKKLREEMKETREALREVLFRKARALCEVARENEGDEAAREAFETAFTDLERWGDPKSDEVFDLKLGREKLRGRLGVALGMLTERIEDEEKPDRDLLERRIALLEELGWPHWAESEQRWLLLKFPAGEIVF
jgi:tripeptidyl-peptidase-2